MANAKYRVLVDWNKDGWFDTGVGAETPLNLVPDPLWGARAVRFLDYTPVSISSQKEVPIVYDPSDYGYSSLSCEEVTSYNNVGFRGFQFSQINADIALGDIPNVNATPLMTGTVNMEYSSLGLVRNSELADKHLDGFSRVLMTTGRISTGGSPQTFYIGYDGVSYTPMVSVTAGQQYTTRLYFRSNPDFTPISGSSFTLSVITQTGTVVATSAGAGFALGFSAVDVTFTAPVGMTGMCLKIIITIGASNDLEAMFFAPQLYANAPGLSEFYGAVDPAIVFNEEQFDAVIPAGQAHTASFWIKQLSGTPAAATGTVVLGVIGSNDYTALTPVVSSTPVIGEWLRMDFPIPSQASRSGVFIHISLNYSLGYRLTGFQVVEGSTPIPFNTGSVSAQYEDVTSYVKDVTWKLGKNEFEDGLPDDGEAQIVLNNESRVFSPSNTESPLYGLMDRGQKVIIQTRWSDTDTWDTRWQGWTDTYEVDPGEFGQRETLLRAVQGVDRMRNSKLWFLTQEDANFVEVVTDMVNESGWVSADDVATSLVGFNTRVGINAFVSDPDASWETMEEGIKPVDFVGFGWDEKTSAHDALTDLLGSQNAHLFVNREGKLDLYNRERFINIWLNFDHDVSMDDQPDATYQYGEDIINSVSVAIQGKRALPSGVLWANKRAIRVVRGGYRELTVNYQFDEGQSKTPIGLDTEMVIERFSSDPGLAGTVTPLDNTTSIVASSPVELFTDGSNRTVLKITNNLPYTAWFMIEISGTAVDRGDNEIAIIEDAAAIEDLNELQKTTMQNKLISTYEEAEAAAWVLLGRRATPGGEFDGFGFYVEDEDTYDLLNDIKVADRIIASEYQTGETDLQHMILEESGSIKSGGLMKVNYKVTRTDQIHYLYAEAQIESKYDNLLWFEDIEATMDGSVTPLSDQIKLLDSGLYGGDYYVGAKIHHLSAPVNWFITINNYSTSPPTRITTLGGEFYLGAGIWNTQDPIGTYSMLPLDPTKKYYFNAWLYAGSDFTGIASDNGVNWNNLVATSNVGSASAIPIVAFYRDNKFRPLTPTTGVPRGQSLQLGASYTPGAFNVVEAPERVTVDSAETYTFSVWARPADGFAAISYTLEAISEDGTLLDSDTSSFNSGGVDILSVTFTGANAVWFRLRKTTSLVARHSLYLYGNKLVEGSIASDTYVNVPNPDFLDIFV